jgi:hypothetical protein
LSDKYFAIILIRFKNLIVCRKKTYGICKEFFPPNTIKLATNIPKRNPFSEGLPGFIFLGFISSMGFIRIYLFNRDLL